MHDTARIAHVFVGRPKTITDDRGTWTSSIARDPVVGPVEIALDGLAGDAVAQPYHGGPDAAVCVHHIYHYRFWGERYGMALRPGAVGENFTLDGITEDDVCAGDILRAGSSLLQVSGPRVPCANLARRIGRDDWVRLTVRENRTGFYMRVLEPGTVEQGDAWRLEERLNPEGSIPAINRCAFLTFDADFAQQMKEMDGLSEWWKELVVDKGAEREAHWSESLRG